MSTNDSLRDLSVKMGDPVSAGRENRLLERVANMRLESAPGRRLGGGSGSTSLPIQTSAAGITVNVSSGHVYFNDDILDVAGVTITASAAKKVWLQLDDVDVPTACTVENGASFPVEAAPPKCRYFHLSEVASDGTTATPDSSWNGGDVVWPTTAGVTTSAGYWS